MPAFSSHKAHGSQFSGGGQSNVGQPSIYEAGDQRNEPQSVIRERERYRDNKVGNRQKEDENYDFEDDIRKKDPRAPATLHGNEPSKGAKIDRELQQDDELRLREKGIK